VSGTTAASAVEGVTERRLPFRQADLVVREAGDGDTVGFLHGMVGSPAAHPLLGAAARTERRLVAPSLPGFTGSPPCADLRTIYDWVAATSEAIDLAGLTGRPMVAASVGAMLALEVASVRPEAFSHLVLVAPLGLWDDDDPVHDPFAATLTVQRRLLSADPEVTAPFFNDPDGIDSDALIEVGIDRYLTRTAAASLVWPLPEHGLASRIHRVGVPVTLVWGSEDQIIPASYHQRFSTALPNVTGSHVIEGAGHLVAWDRPGEVAALVAGLG
jgi:pimeloyl-ACP methyl ester carboxylesterase